MSPMTLVDGSDRQETRIAQERDLARRRLMELAKSSTSLEEAAKQLGRSPDAIKRMALRLGLSLKSKATKKD